MFQKIRDKIEQFIPMTLSSLVLFLVIIYLLIVVTKTVVSNYKSNQDLLVSEQKLVVMQQEITDMANAVNYYETNSFKEKEAREKLGYKAEGESVIALPLDTKDDKAVDSEIVEATVREPNYRLWVRYFFGSENQTK